MNVAGFLRWALTKPVIIVLVLLAGITGGAIGWKSTTTQFETSAAVLVIGPGAGSRNAMDNPFTGLNSGAAQVAHVLTTIAQSAEGREVLEKTGSSPDVVMIASAGDGSSTQISPLITFTVSAPEAWRSEAGANALIEFWRTELRKMQVDAGVVGNTFADLRVPVSPRPGTEVGGNPVRAAMGLAMGAALATLTLCLIVAAAWEAFRARRHKGSGDTSRTVPIPVSAPTAPAASEELTADSAALAGIVPAAPGVGADQHGDAPSRTVPAAIPIRPPGDAARRAMTRWRDRVEEVPEESEIPLPDLPADIEDTAAGGRVQNA